MQRNWWTFCVMMAAFGGLGVPRADGAEGIDVAAADSPDGSSTLSVGAGAAGAHLSVPNLGKIGKTSHRTFHFEGRAYEHLVREGTLGRFEAVLAHGASTAAFSGLTGQVGDPGEREGVFLKFIGDANAPTTVDLASTRDGARVCGEEELAATDTRTLKGGRFVRVSRLPLSPSRIAGAVATRAGDPFVPIDATIFALTSASRPDFGRVAADRVHGASMGVNAFATFHAPKLTLDRVRLSFAPAGNARNVYLVSRSAVYRVTIPQAASEVVVALPAPETSTCWSLVAEAALDLRAADAHAIIFDKAQTPSELAALVVTSEGDAAAAVEALRVLGRDGSAALDGRIGDIPERMLTNVESALSGMPCDALVSPMARLGVRAKGALATRARHHLERCARTALDDMVNLLAEPSPRGLLAADVLAHTAPKEVCTALLKWPGKGEAALRRSARAILTRVADRCDADMAQSAIEHATGDARTDLLFGFRESGNELSKPLLEASRGALLGDFESRWMALGVFNALAIAGNHDGVVALEVAIGKETEPHLLARACSGLASGRGSQTVLLTLARHGHPRVREAAILALSRVEGSVAAAAMSDAWAFVREAAATRLTEPDRLATMLHDHVPDVRIAALRSMAASKRETSVAPVAAVLRDRRELTHVRREAAAALGALCGTTTHDAVAALTDVAMGAAHGDDSDRELGVDVIRNLAVLDETSARSLAKQWPPRAALSMANEIRDARRTSICTR